MDYSNFGAHDAIAIAESAEHLDLPSGVVKTMKFLLGELEDVRQSKEQYRQWWYEAKDKADK